jgi:hypothetical protein
MCIFYSTRRRSDSLHAGITGPCSDSFHIGQDCCLHCNKKIYKVEWCVFFNKDGFKMKTQISLILLGLGLASASAYAGMVAEPMLCTGQKIELT